MIASGKFFDKCLIESECELNVFGFIKRETKIETFSAFRF